MWFNSSLQMLPLRKSVVLGVDIGILDIVYYAEVRKQHLATQATLEHRLHPPKLDPEFHGGWKTIRLPTGFR